MTHSEIIPVSTMHTWVEPLWANCLKSMGVPFVYYRKHRYVVFGGKYEIFFARLSRCDTYVRIIGEVSYTIESSYGKNFILSILYAEVYDSLYYIYGDQFDIDQYFKDDTMNIEFSVNVPIKDHKYENINMAIKTYYEQLDLVKTAGLKLGLEFEVEPEVRKALCFKSA